MTLIPNPKKPILYSVHTDSILGPTVGIPDAFRDTQPTVGGASKPDVDYIFLSLPIANGPRHGKNISCSGTVT